MNIDKLKIRKAIEADYKSVNLLYYNTYSLYHQNIPKSYKETPSNILPRGTFLNIIDDKNCLMLVAEYEGKVVGVLYANIESADDDEVTYGYHRVSIDEVSIDPDYRSMGIGSKLMQEAENWARQNNISDLTTLAYTFNDRAVRFYENNGYEPYSIKLDKKI